MTATTYIGSTSPDRIKDPVPRKCARPRCIETLFVPAAYARSNRNAIYVCTRCACNG